MADIQDSIQRMREGDLSSQPGADKQSVEARLSSSCPSLAVDSGEEAETIGGVVTDQLTPVQSRGSRAGARQGAGGARGRRSAGGRGGRARSPSVSTGDSDEDTVSDQASDPQRVSSMGVAVGPAGLTPGQLTSLHKSVSTPSMVTQHNDHAHHQDNNSPHNKAG